MGSIIWTLVPVIVNCEMKKTKENKKNREKGGRTEDREEVEDKGQSVEEGLPVNSKTYQLLRPPKAWITDSHKRAQPLTGSQKVAAQPAHEVVTTSYSGRFRSRRRKRENDVVVTSLLRPEATSQT